MNKYVKLEPFSGISQKTGSEYECFKLSVGDWSTLIFPRSKFERDYIKSILRTN